MDKILQIIPATGIAAQYKDEKEKVVDEIPVACWALIRTPDDLDKDDPFYYHVIGMVIMRGIVDLVGVDEENSPSYHFAEYVYG